MVWFKKGKAQKVVSRKSWKQVLRNANARAAAGGVSTVAYHEADNVQANPQAVQVAQFMPTATPRQLTCFTLGV